MRNPRKPSGEGNPQYRVFATLSRWDYQELSRLAEGVGESRAAFARHVISQYLRSPAAASLGRRVTGDSNSESQGQGEEK